MFKIEKDVPVPEGRSGVQKYPFHEMQAGDSFLLPREGNINAARRSATAYGARHNKVFTARKTPDGLRIWRVS